MKMVSAAKMRGAENRMRAGRPFTVRQPPFLLPLLAHAANQLTLMYLYVYL